jgi:hypothetical protein
MLEWMLDFFGVAVLVGQAALFLAVGDIEASCPRLNRPGWPRAVADSEPQDGSKSGR